MLPSYRAVVDDPTALMLTTSIVSLLSGFLLGVYSVRGYLISPEMREERRHNQHDPVESDESDVEIDAGVGHVLDHAPNWVNGEEADRKQGLRIDRSALADRERRREEAEERKKDARKESISALDAGEECKLVLVVRTDLGMTKGKIAAQCSHATLACFKKLSNYAITHPMSHEAAILRNWERHGQAKIALQIDSEDALMKLYESAKERGLTAEYIQDAGRTQIAAGSTTVLGVGPAPKSMVNEVTGHLKLL